MEPYKDRSWMYFHYVQKRLTLTKIQAILQDKHGITISQQALYNWVKKFDLLRYRGRGRNLKPQTGMKKTVKSPMQKQMEKFKREQRQRFKKKR